MRLASGRLGKRTEATEGRLKTEGEEREREDLQANCGVAGERAAQSPDGLLLLHVRLLDEQQGATLRRRRRRRKRRRKRKRRLVGEIRGENEREDDEEDEEEEKEKEEARALCKEQVLCQQVVESIVRDEGQRECEDENATPTKKVKRRARPSGRERPLEAKTTSNSSITTMMRIPLIFWPMLLLLVLVCLSSGSVGGQWPMTMAMAMAASPSGGHAQLAAGEAVQRRHLASDYESPYSAESPPLVRSEGVAAAAAAAAADEDDDEELGLERPIPGGRLAGNSERARAGGFPSPTAAAYTSTTSSWFEATPLAPALANESSSSSSEGRARETQTVERQDSLFAWFFSNIDDQWKVVLLIVIAGILNLVTIIGNIMVLISFKMDRS